MNKLIYFTLGNNIEYLEIAKLHIESLKKQNCEVDLLFITNYKDLVLKKIQFIKEPYFLEVEHTDLLKSSSNKLRIHQFENVYNYDKILYCDLDTLWVDNPDVLFDKIHDDKIYVTNETPLMSKDFWWGGSFFTDDEKKDIELKNIKGINAGFFGFTKNSIFHFKNMEKFFNDNIYKSNHCLEQPYFNVYLYRNNLYDTILNSYVSHEGYMINNYTGVLLHFAGGPGSSQQKILKMINYYEKNIK